MRSGVQLPCPDSRTAELRLELQVGYGVWVKGRGSGGVQLPCPFGRTAEQLHTHRTSSPLTVY